jgi:HPr kinase/phosphorylase
MAELTVERLYQARNRDLELTLLSGGQQSLQKKVKTSQLHRPGLALTGFMERFPHDRIQVLGETEIVYLNTVPEPVLRENSQRILSLDVPFFVVSKGLIPPAGFVEIAAKSQTAVFASRLATAELVGRLTAYLDHIFAPTTNLHGTLVDVYGVGLLYTGKSGIGKSEVALDLVERGHRLVADDVCRVTRVAPDVLIGGSSELLGHHMEIRGVGIIDIEELFGIRSIRLQKRIEVEVRLTLWEETVDYERLGVEDQYTSILGVRIPMLHVPISPGKNITVISEVIAMNHMLKVYGENSAVELSKKLAQRLSRRSLTEDYLESDYE